MTDFAQLVLAADTRQMTGAEKAIDKVTAAGARAEKGMDRLDKETKQASASVKKLSGTADGATAVLKRLGAAAAAAFGSKAILSAAETYTKMDNSLRALGLSADQAQRRLSEIAGIATRTRAPLESTVQLYSRLSLAAGELGASSKQLSQFTETVGMSLSAAGIGANEASGSLLQLSQALSGGIVRAEEFNSIVEGAFPIARLAAQGIDEAGGSVARLRNLVIDGKISSKEFFDAILEGSASAQAAFGQTNVTIGQAMTALNNSFVMLAGGVDRALGATSAMANAIVFVADNLGRFASYAVAAGGAFAGAYVIGLLNAARATMTLTGALTLLRGAIIRTGIGALVIGAGELIYQFSQLVERVGGVGNAFSLLGDVAAGVWTGMIDSAAAIPPALNGVWEKMKGGFLLALSGMATAFHDFIWNIANGLQGIPGLDAIGNKLMGVAEAASSASGSLARAGYAAQDAAKGSFENAGKTISDAFGPARDAVAALNNAIADNASVTGDAEDAASGFSNALDDADAKAKKLKKDLEKTPQIVDDLADAWGNFVVNGFKDFKGFVSNVLGSFKNMIAQMIASAAKSKILSYLGFGSAATAASATAASAGGLTALAGAGGVAGAVGGIASGVGGILSGGGLSASFANLGGLVTGATAGWGAIGAALPAIGVIGAAFSFFSKKTKELDSGLMLTVENMDAFVESFRTIKTTRFWGLSSKTSTSLSEVGAEISDPIVQAVQSIQQTVLDASASFGIAESAFDNFFYDMKISLKGLTEDQALAKINEELAKMGDAFASLTGHFASMNELIEAANQRLELQTRLDGLLGNNSAILARQRQAELAAMHELNRPLAQAIYNLEDAQSAVTSAFASLRASIDKVVSDLQEKLSVANSAVDRSRSIIGLLEQALSSRTIARSNAQTFARRSSALNFLRSGNLQDEKALNDALKIVGEPTEQLYGSFVDYARDFFKTSNVIEEAKKTAETQLTADEKQVALLEQQIADAESQYQVMVDQYNALLGIDTSVKSVEAAVGTLRGAIEALAAAQAAAKAAASAGIGGSAAAASDKSFAELYGTGDQYKGYDLAKLSGTSDLLNAASLLGIGTTGKTGAEIQQAISNATQMAVNLDNATRAKKFAMGGNHSGGFRIVGEKGPELEYTGPSRIIPNDKISIGGGDPALRMEVARLREDLSNALMQIAKYTRKSSDTLNKFDYQGLPADRGF